MTTHNDYFHPPMAGLKMPMCCTQAERRRVEQILNAAKLRGTYLPLRPWATPWSMLWLMDLVVFIMF